MIIEMFVLRILNLMSSDVLSRSASELREVELNSKKAMDAYEAIVMSNTL